MCPGRRLPVHRLCAEDPRPADELDLLHSRLIDEEYTRHPFYGTRRMVVYLETVGHRVNRKRVQRLMRLMGLAGMAPGPNTSRLSSQSCSSSLPDRYRQYKRHPRARKSVSSC